MTTTVSLAASSSPTDVQTAHNTTSRGGLATFVGRLDRLPQRRHSIAAVGSVVAVAVTNAVLTASYNASKFPVSFAEGQTSFDGETIKGYYAHLAAEGTMGTYWLTQVIDFAFIAAVIAFGLVVGTRFARALGHTTLAARVALVSGAMAAFGAVCDAVENLWSFVMLAQPTDFPNWLAIPYSGSAVAKFAFEGVGVVALALIAVGLVIRSVARAITR